jgi:hypothetical protein
MNQTAYVLTLYGTGTAWMTTAPAFSIAGVAGVSVGATTVISDGTATVPITTGTTAGTATITDNSNGMIASLLIKRSHSMWISRRR